MSSKKVMEIIQKLRCRLRHIDENLQGVTESIKQFVTLATVDEFELLRKASLELNQKYAETRRSLTRAERLYLNMRKRDLQIKT